MPLKITFQRTMWAMGRILATLCWADWAGLTWGSSCSGLRELGKALPLFAADQTPAAKISTAEPNWAAAEQLWARQRWAQGWGLARGLAQGQEHQGSEGLLHPALAPFSEHTVEESCQPFFLSSHAWKKQHPQPNKGGFEPQGKREKAPAHPNSAPACSSLSSLPNEVTPQR